MTLFESDVKQAQRILSEALEVYQPTALVCLFSGGYDSMIASHLVHRLNVSGHTVHVWSIDTNLAADGWHDYVSGVARQYGWDFEIYNNRAGFEEFVESVKLKGCPRNRPAHTWAYRRLKERGIRAIHMKYKDKRSDKTLFISGMRRAESTDRSMADEYHRVDKSNLCFVAPIVHWSDFDCDQYRVRFGLPGNPFYDTVKGSGDCQCNWGDFINMRTLKKYSPELANGNVAILDEISRIRHGYGWDGAIVGQSELFKFVDTEDEEANLESPFLCQNCSRTKTRVPTDTVEYRYLQSGLFDDDREEG